jgi:hypothetical protein
MSVAFEALRRRTDGFITDAVIFEVAPFVLTRAVSQYDQSLPSRDIEACAKTLGRKRKRRTTMRKRLIKNYRDDVSSSSPLWLNIEQLAQVEITSEAPACPIESALTPGTYPGWRAAHPGAQVIRLVFDAPQELHRLHLVFSEAQHERTQEFVVQGSADGGQSHIPPNYVVEHVIGSSKAA